MCRESKILILPKKEPKIQMCSLVTLTHLIFHEVQVYPLFSVPCVGTTRTYVLLHCVHSMLIYAWLLLSVFMWRGHSVLWSWSKFKHVLNFCIFVQLGAHGYRLVICTFMMSPSALYWKTKWIRLHAAVVSKPFEAAWMLIKVTAHYLLETII